MSGSSGDIDLSHTFARMLGWNMKRPIDSLLWTAQRGLGLTALTLIASALGMGGCSLIVDSEKTQCKVDADCSTFSDASALACQEGLCVAATALPPSEWTCLDTPPAPTMLPGPFQVTLQAKHMVSQTGLSGVAARACRTLDVGCSAPQGTGTTDADGKVTMSLPAAFRGYVALDRSDLMPTMYFFNPPIDHDQDIGEVQMGEPFIGTGLSQQTGAVQKADRGIVLISAYNCQQHGSAGISFSSANADADTTRFYSAGSLPSITASATDVDGFGGFINAPAGGMTIDAVRTSDQRSIGAVSILVKAGGLTITRVSPGI
ncbi:MAG: hypothetical protein JWN04_2622 [Myxococcaceae bacterium]|nr:hypothetical protein [Myxococcaceae bacterium]